METRKRLQKLLLAAVATALAPGVAHAGTIVGKATLEGGGSSALGAGTELESSGVGTTGVA